MHLHIKIRMYKSQQMPKSYLFRACVAVMLTATGSTLHATL